MLKKILLSIAALALISTALADESMISEASELSAVPNDVFEPGFYLGVQGGYAVNGWKAIDGTIVKVSNSENLGGRGFIGYDFTQNWALEAGYTHFGTKAKVTDILFPTSSVVVAKIITQAADITGKGKLPITDNFGVYAKLGIGYLMSTGLQKKEETSWFSKNNQNNLAAVIGAGASYYFLPNFWIDLSWTGFIVNKKLGNEGTYYFGKYQPNANLYALGIYYKFTF